MTDELGLPRQLLCEQVLWLRAMRRRVALRRTLEKAHHWLMRYAAAGVQC